MPQLRLVQSHFPVAPCNCSVVLHASNTCSPTSDTSWKSCPHWSTPQPSLPSNCLYTAAATPFFVYHGGGGRTPTGWPHIAPLSQKGWMHLTCSTQHIQANPSAGPPNQSLTTTPLPPPEHWSNLKHPVKVSTDGHLLVQLGALRQAARAAHVVKPAVKHSTTKPVVKNKYLIGEFSLQGQLLQLNSTLTSQAIDCTPLCTVTILFFLFFKLLFNQNTIQSKGSDPPPRRRSSLRLDEEGAGVRLSLSTTSRPLCCHQKTAAPLLLAPAMSLGTPPLASQQHATRMKSPPLESPTTSIMFWFTRGGGLPPAGHT